VQRRFEQQVVLVSGATSGIGAATARQFLDEGAHVVFCGLEADGANALCAYAPQRTTYVNVDLREPQSCTAFVEAAVAQWGHIDVIVNNAASVVRGRIEQTDAVFFDEMMALNVRAPLLIVRHALPSMRTNATGGVVINIGSLNAYVGAPELLAYATSKGALMTMTRNLAAAHRHEHIRFHCLNIGWTHTDGEDRLQQQLNGRSDWHVTAGKTRPTGVLLRPTDIAQAVLFYASPAAAAFSGAAIDLEQMPI
jgi:NAD(P)-dependent dehydrogenase (short-subunit alcohol dehydrogenase family)